MYDSMLGQDGKSSLKAIVAQCLASILKWDTSIEPEGVGEESMFDLDLYRYQTDPRKQAKLKQQIEKDAYLKYLVNAIKYAAGVE